MGSSRRKFTSAHVIAVIALVVALGGTGYAALSLPKNSVGSKQIKKNAVNSSKVKNRSLKAIDFRKGQLPRGRVGPQGVQGPSGPTGPTGPTGTFGPVTTVFAQSAADIPAGTSNTINAFCPAGQRAIGGGARGDREDSEKTVVTSSRPSVSAANTEPPADGETFTGWRATILHNAGDGTAGIRGEVWVICAAAP